MKALRTAVASAALFALFSGFVQDQWTPIADRLSFILGSKIEHNSFSGVAVRLLLERAGRRPEARYCLVSAEQQFTTNLPLADLDMPANLVALTHDGEPLTPEHGWPARLLVPHLYFWKSAKWVRGLTLLDTDVPGFWEQNGYHMHGDPWTEERYGGRGLTQHDINRLRNLSKRT